MTEPSEPQYPQHSQMPQYPTAPPYPQAPPPPQAPPYPQAPPVVPPQPSHPPVPHPHELRFEQRRVHISEHQRGADGTAISGLLLHVPNFVCSLLVVGMVSAFFGLLGIALVLAWLASGALIFHRPTERVIARRLLKLRAPTPPGAGQAHPGVAGGPRAGRDRGDHL